MTDSKRTTATIFQFQPDTGASHEVRTMTLDGEPWFVAKDVCDVLGYADHINAIKQHCRGVVKRHLIDTLGRLQEMTTIPERDVYRLIMRSKLPSAERFEEWVVGTVLPAIRKTGSYIRGEEALDPNAPDYLDRLKDLLIKAQERKLEAAEAQIAVLKPKAEAFRVIEEASGGLTVTAAAKALKSKRVNLFAFLEANHWLTTKKGNREATAAAIRSGYMATRTYTDPAGRIHTTPMVTPKGLSKLAQIKAQRAA